MVVLVVMVAIMVVVVSRGGCGSGDNCGDGSSGGGDDGDNSGGSSGCIVVVVVTVVCSSLTSGLGDCGGKIDLFILGVNTGMPSLAPYYLGKSIETATKSCLRTYQGNSHLETMQVVNVPTSYQTLLCGENLTKIFNSYKN